MVRDIEILKPTVGRAVWAILPLYAPENCKEGTLEALRRNGANVFRCSLKTARWIAKQAGFERDADMGPYTPEELDLPLPNDTYIVETWTKKGK